MFSTDRRLAALYSRVRTHLAGPIAPLGRLSPAERREAAQWCAAMDAYKQTPDERGPPGPPRFIIGGSPRRDPPPLPVRVRGRRSIAALAAAALLMGCGVEPDVFIKPPPEDAGAGEGGTDDAGGQ